MDTFEVLIANTDVNKVGGLLRSHLRGGWGTSGIRAITEIAPAALTPLLSQAGLVTVTIAPVAEADVDKIAEDLRSWRTASPNAFGGLINYIRIPGPRPARKEAEDALRRYLIEAAGAETPGVFIGKLIAAVREDLEHNPTKRELNREVG